jgi:hypothetical protein
MDRKFIYRGADLNNFADAEQLGISNHIEFSKKKMSSKFEHIAEAGISYCMNFEDKLDDDQL